MRRAIPLLLLVVVLLTGGVVVGRFTASSNPASRETQAPPLLDAGPRSEPAAAAPAPVLLGRPADAASNSECARLQGALQALRADRDRLAAELEQFKELTRRWDTLVELERVQRAANEIAAIATSRNAISALAQMQAMARIDEDADGTGEYAGFLEMSGGAVGRMTTGTTLNPPVLSGAFRTLTKHGEAYRSGYLYRIFLPDGRGNGVGEGPEGFLPAQVDADLAETTWCMYAWPAAGTEVGQKTFFTNQAGDVLVTEDLRYNGPGGGPAADAAFRRPGITGQTAIGTTGNDGNTWIQAN